VVSKIRTRPGSRAMTAGVMVKRSEYELESF
jgi:hypothetical protein